MSLILRVSDNKVIGKTNHMLKSGMLLMVSFYVDKGEQGVITLRKPFKAKVSNNKRLGERAIHYTDTKARKLEGFDNHYRLL